MGKKAAGRQVLCTHRRVTPALGARLLRSYVPLRYGPSESASAMDISIGLAVSKSCFLRSDKKGSRPVKGRKPFLSF